MRSVGKKAMLASWIEVHFGEVSDPLKRIERAECSLINILVFALTLFERYNTKRTKSLRRKLRMTRTIDAYLSRLFLVGSP